MLDIGAVFSNLLGLFLLIGVGYASVRFGVLPASSTKLFSALLMKITTPAIIFTSMVRPFDPAFLRSGVTAAVLGGVLYLLYSLAGAALQRVFRVEKRRRGIWIFSCTFNNNGFMGFPVTQALFGADGVALAAFMGIPFNLMAYVYGAKLIGMDHSVVSGAPPVPWRSILCTAINAATFLGLVFYGFQIPIPEFLASPLGYLADVTTPLSMLIIGMTLAGGQISNVFRSKDVFSCTFMRLLLLPVLTFGLLEALPGLDPFLIGVIVILMSMPSPAISTILAETYGGDSEFASEAVFLSSLLCLGSIPLISLLL